MPITHPTPWTGPTPTGLADAPLPPAAAWEDPRHGNHLAVLGDHDPRPSHDPHARVLDCDQRADPAGARPAGWDIRGLAAPSGTTHRQRRRHPRSEQP